MAESQVTLDHDEIRRWVEQRGGWPATVKGSDVLRIDYPGFSGEETLQRITWKEFFEAFEKHKLAFLYQDELESGKESRFSKLIDRNSGEARSAKA
jgi:hypothetical protein